jgi:hypothetical protein
LRRVTKFRLLLLLGICVYVPFVLFSITLQLFLGVFFFSVCFLFYCYAVYHFVWKRAKPKYPMVPPEGRMDVYFPRTNIPRPVYEDVQRHPEFFKRKMKKYERTRRVKKKSQR